MKIEEFIDLARKQGLLKLQITEFNSYVITANIINDKLKDYNVNEETEYQIKARRDNKYARLNTNYLDKDIIDLLIFKFENIETQYEDLLIDKTKPIKSDNSKIEIDHSKEINKIIELNKLRKDNSKVSSLESMYEYSYQLKRIVNTEGQDIETSRNQFFFYIEATGEDKDNVVTIEDLIYSPSIEEMNYEEITKKVIEKVNLSLNKKEIESKKYDIVFSSMFMSSILSLATSAFSKTRIREKTSCLENLIGKQIASDKITIVEDAQNKSMPSYTKFDNEGVETYYKKIVENGILKTYLYNNKEALLENCKSTANGYDNISVSNMYIEPGNISLDEIVEKIDNGLYITNYMESGGTILNVANGEIAAQVFGFIIKDGKITNGIKSSILNTTLIEMLKNVKEVSNTVEFKTPNIGSPALLIENMSISSN